MKKILFEDGAIFFLYSFKHFGDKCGVLGARFGDFFGSSRNDPKSIGIHQESLISN